MKLFKGLFGIRKLGKIVKTYFGPSDPAVAAESAGLCHNPATIPPNITPAEAAWLCGDKKQGKHAIAVAVATAAAGAVAVVSDRLCHNPVTIPPNITPAEVAWLCGDKKHHKHTIAVAAATSAAMGSAVAARQTAVKLTSQGENENESTESENCAASPLTPGNTDNDHQLRVYHNRLLQWRYVNDRADSVHQNVNKEAEANFVYVSDGLINLRQSVVQKKLQLDRQKLEMKLNSVLHSQLKLLEAWGSIERQHSSAVSVTLDCLQSAVCRVPLIEGVTVEPQSTIIALQCASDISSSIMVTLSNFSSGAEKTAKVINEMAKVVEQEKFLLEDCWELFNNISALEIEERSLKCSIIQLRQQQEHYCKKEKEMVSV